MPIDPNADITLFAFSWVPELARGYVRDHRARWAMEEAGIGYKTKLVHAAEEKPEWYLAEQPFGKEARPSPALAKMVGDDTFAGGRRDACLEGPCKILKLTEQFTQRLGLWP